MHILHLYKDYFPILGGIENHLRDLGEGLAARGHQITILVTSLTRQTVIEHPRPGLTIIKAARTFHLASTPFSLDMLRWARRLRADIAHLHFPYPLADLAYLALPQRPPLVVTYHSDIVRQRMLLHAYRPLLGRTLRHAARIIATSPNYIKSSPFLRPLAARCTVIPLGVDTSRFERVDQQQVAALSVRYSLPPAGALLLFVGRLRYYKGLHILLDALAAPELAAEGVLRAELLIAGSGPERERLAAQANRLGIAGRVHFLGDVSDDDLPALYHAADIFILPAHLRAEALGVVQIEALASGTPCISTDIGTGTSYVNRHSETGLVVPPANPSALAHAIVKLLADPDLRQRYGAAGPKRVAALFTQEHMLDSIEHLYRDVLTASAERLEKRGS